MNSDTTSICGMSIFLEFLLIFLYCRLLLNLLVAYISIFMFFIKNTKLIFYECVRTGSSYFFFEFANNFGIFFNIIIP